MSKHTKLLYGWLLAILFLFSSCLNSTSSQRTPIPPSESDVSESSASWQKDLLPYAGKPNVSVHGGLPFFTPDEISTEDFEKYGDLDEFGRCTAAFANICPDTMPQEERESIGAVKPTGWHTVKYDLISDQYLYNRCHLIGYQLAGENANEKNLITGTRYLNIEGMLPLENLVADYVSETGNHVLYRVTPYFQDENLVASGVLIEAYSVEDCGFGICFNKYCYNVQPGIWIDYATGESGIDESWDPHASFRSDPEYDYICNSNTMKFHKPDCTSVSDMNDKNKEYFKGKRSELIDKGYLPCGRCHP